MSNPTKKTLQEVAEIMREAGWTRDKTYGPQVGGSAIVSVDSSFDHATQTVGSALGLDASQRSELKSLVRSLEAELKKLDRDRADEAEAIAGALETAVANAAKPKAERKPSLLQFSAKSLKEAAELVKDVAPPVLTTAGEIAKFIVAL
jgi:hypothetical protein